MTALWPSSHRKNLRWTIKKTITGDNENNRRQVLNVSRGSCVSPLAECSADCQRCTADLQTGIGSVCLWCKEPRTWLLGDHCVSQCPRGRYSWHGACMSKNWHHPTFKREGWWAYLTCIFSSHQIIIILFFFPPGCHSSCEACSGAGPLSCTSCPAHTVLLPSGLCAPRCPLGHYDNGHRVCQGKSGTVSSSVADDA